MRADESDFGLGPVLFDGFGDFGVVFQRRGRSVDDDVIVVLRFFEALFDMNVVRWTIHQPGIGHQRGGLGEPRWIPEAGDFAACLIARAGAAIEAVK